VCVCARGRAESVWKRGELFCCGAVRARKERGGWLPWDAGSRVGRWCLTLQATSSPKSRRSAKTDGKWGREGGQVRLYQSKGREGQEDDAVLAGSGAHTRLHYKEASAHHHPSCISNANAGTRTNGIRCLVLLSISKSAYSIIYTGLLWVRAFGATSLQHLSDFGGKFDIAKWRNGEMANAVGLTTRRATSREM